LTLPPIRDGLIDLLADAALQGERPELRAMARWLIGKLAPQMGVTLGAEPPDRSGRFTRVSVECDVSSFYAFLRARFRHFLDAGGGLDVIGGDLTSAGARSGLDAVAVAAAIQEGFCGEIFLPVAETPDAPWRLFAVRSERVTNARVVEKTLWEELVSAQSEGISGVVVRGAEDAGSP